MLNGLKGRFRNQIRKHPHLRYYFKVAQRELLGTKYGNFYYRGVRKLLDNIDFDSPPKKQERPQSSLIEITNACNLNCLMCNTKLSNRPEGLMNPEVFERIIVQLKSIGVPSAGLHTVGETFVYKDLESLFEIAKKHNFRVWVSTNAQFPKRIEPLFRKFPTMFSDLRISVDGATRKTFEHIRVGGSFDKVIETLEVVHKLSAGKRGFRIGVTIDSVLNLETVREIPLYFETFGKYVFPEHINFSVITGLSPDDKYFWSTFPFKHLIRSAVPCFMPFTNQYFTYDGKATMCCRDYNAEITAGDIMEKDAMEIWNGAKAETVRRQHLQPKTLEIEACKNCFTPYDFTTPITNKFIHFARIKLPELSALDFANAVIALWEGMNDALEIRDVPKLKNSVIKTFQEVDSGRCPVPQKNILESCTKASSLPSPM